MNSNNDQDDQNDQDYPYSQSNLINILELRLLKDIDNAC